MSTPFTSVAELRQRVAAVVEALDGFGEVPWPLGVGAAPNGYETHAFTVRVSESVNTNTYRDSAGMGARVASTVVVEFVGAVIRAEPGAASSLDTATDAEALVIRAVMNHGALGILVPRYVSSARDVPDESVFLTVAVTFAVDHVVRLG